MEDILPIGASRSVIEQAVRLHRVVIIQAETGAGKSTQVPQYLLSQARQVIVTQPRRIAASSIAKRVAEEMGVKLGDLVGYKTATASKASEETRLLFCTDGLEVMRQFFEGAPREDLIVVIDEAHEWNLNQELLFAWFHKQLSLGLNFRLVITTAGMGAELDLLGTYFEDAEIISSKGRMFPITEMKPKGGVLDATRMLLKQRCNVLVFVPGKGEINRLVRRLKNEGVDADVLPLYAGISEADQAACFLTYPRPKCIVSTNVAQTSLTIPDIDAVVDSGMERRPEIVDGVEGLYLRPISLDDREQRKGRGGRVRPGIYIDCCPASVEQRKLFPRAAILTHALEGLVLQLACDGLKPEDLKFFHRPPQKHLDLAKATLKKLRCIDENGDVTPTGRRVSAMPIGVRYARMIESTYKKRPGYWGLVDEPVVTLAVILEEGSIRNGKSEKWREHAPPAPEIGESDAYVELAAFEAAQNLPVEQLEEIGIDPDAFERVRDSRQRVVAGLRSRGMRLWRVSHVTLQRAIAAGFADQLYKRSLGSDDYIRLGARTMPRRLPADSCVKGAEHVVGIPWNFQVDGEFGPKTMRLLHAATEISPRVVEQL